MDSRILELRFQIGMNGGNYVLDGYVSDALNYLWKSVGDFWKILFDFCTSNLVI
ncbi:MAG: hypothetical protein WBH60_08540 [Fervidobacterium sp.]